MSIQEKWKPVKGFEDRYSISNKGRVKSTTTNKEVSVRNSATLFLNGERHNIRINRLMRENWEFEFISQLGKDEEAKRVKGYPNYFVTSKARVWSNIRQRWLIPTQDKGTYYHNTRLTHNGKTRAFTLHQLVGQHFLEGWSNDRLVLHKKEELAYPEIHSVENLYLGDKKRNIIDCMEKERFPCCHFTAKQVLDIREQVNNSIKSQAELARLYGVKIQTINDLIRGRTYQWVN